MLGMSATLLLFMGGFTACGDDEEIVEPTAPGAPQVTASTADTSVTVSWLQVTGASSYRTALDDGTDTLPMTPAAGEVQVVYYPADGIEDDVTYTVYVYAINDVGETPNASPPTVLTNYFPWDENFEISLHATGTGKMTWYDETPNEGFEKYTGVVYDDLSCKGCHEPATTGGCEACHDTANPTFGAQVDATLTGACGACHGRQKAEAIVHGYSDHHRDDLGYDCMDCHTLEDVMGDGNSYASMLDDGAIDASCDDCHTTLATNTAHTIHSATVDCSACHIQSVVTCYNCHFETELQLDTKKAYGQFKDWLFLVNFRGKVHAANFQSVKIGAGPDGQTFIAMAPFYAHTVEASVRSCGDCHQNAAVTDYFADGVIDVVTWNAGSSSLEYMTGVIPVPPDPITAMRFDFVDLDVPGGTTWDFLETGPDTLHMVYGTPLTAAQMTKLNQ